MKVETDSIAANLTGRPVILISDNTCQDLQSWLYCFYRWCQNVFDVTMTDKFQYQSQFLHMRARNWPNIFVDQGQFSDPDFISGTHQREKFTRNNPKNFAPLSAIEKNIWFFDIKSWFFTRNIPKMFAPPLRSAQLF